MMNDVWRSPRGGAVDWWGCNRGCGSFEVLLRMQCSENTEFWWNVFLDKSIVTATLATGYTDVA